MSVTTPDHDWDFRITSENETNYQFGDAGTLEAGVFDYISNKAAVYKSSGSTQSSNTTDGVVNSSTNWIDIGALTYGTNVSVEMYLKGTGTTTSDATIFNITKYESSVYDELYVNFADTTGNVGYVQQVAGTSSSSTLSNTVIPRNNSGYNHFVVTIDGTTLKTYLDGVLKDTVTITSFSGERSNFYLGANRSTITNTGNEMNIKYCRLWKNNTLSASNVTYLNTNKDTNYLFRTTPPPLPKNSWDFRVSTPSSKIVYDEVSNAAATYINNTISDTTDGATFTFLDDNNSTATTTGDYIQLDKYDWKTNNWSIEMYAYITDHQQYDGLFDIAAHAANTYKISVGFANSTTTSDPANPLRILYYNSYFEPAKHGVISYTAKETTVVRNAWNHYVFTYDSDSQVLSVMINGNIRFYQTDTAPDTSSATDILVSDLTTNPTFVIGSGGRSGIGMKTKYFRIWNGTMISEVQALKLYELRETSHIYSNISSLLTLGYSHSEIINTFGKTLADYKAANISIADTPFAIFSNVNKYKQTYFKNMLDISGEFVHRKHTFYGDISFNNDLSVNNFMIVNKDVSLNAGFIVNGDASFNGNVNAIGDVSLNGTLKLKDKSIETSALNFTIIANEGTFDSAQDVSLNSTFTVQGDFDRYIDTAGNIQTDFSENVVLIPGSLGLDLSGGGATLSGKTGDQAFLNGSYIVHDNSNNSQGFIYETLDISQNSLVVTSLESNWNKTQVNGTGHWLYDGSSNYTTYIDEDGNTQTVKGDNYDLTVPFHFYPSSAVLRSVPETIDELKFPASVKVLGSSVETTIDDVAASVGTPTYNYDFKHNQSIVDNISNNGGTLQEDAYIGADGLTLDGTGDRFEIDPSNFTWGGTNTMEIYVKLTTQASTGNKGIMGFGGDNVSTGGAYFIMQTGTAQTNYGYRQLPDSGSTISVDTTTSINYGSFDHHVFVFDPTSGIKYYINGTLVDDSGAAYTSTAQTRSGYEYRVGAPPYNDATTGIAGVFSHVRIWNNVALSSDQVTTLYNNRNNNISFKNSISKYHLLGEFDNDPFYGKSSLVHSDSSLNYTYNTAVFETFTGSITTPTYNWDYRNNQSLNDNIGGNAGAFVNDASLNSFGLSHYSMGNCASVTNYPFGGSCTLELYCFVTTAHPEGTRAFYGHTTSGSGYFWIGVSETNLWEWYIHTDSASKARHFYEHIETESAAVIGGWNHVVMVWEPSSSTKTIILYINGKEITACTHVAGQTTSYANNSGGTNTSSGTYTFNSTTRGGYYYVGGHMYNAAVSNTTSTSTGVTAHVRFWSGTALSSTDVSNLYKYREQFTFSSSGYSMKNTTNLNYLHGYDFLLKLNRKYYVNHLRMVIDKAPSLVNGTYLTKHIDNDFNYSFIQKGQDITMHFDQGSLGSGVQSDGVRFGTFVSMNGDGSMILVTAQQEINTNITKGTYRIYKYNKSISQWEQHGNTIPGTSTSSITSSSLLSDDGSRVLIAQADSSGLGRLRIFEFTNGDWSQIGSDLQGSNNAGTTGDLRRTVWFSGDGNTVGGASTQNSTASERMAKTWRWNGSDWAQIGSAFLVNQDNTTSDTSQHSAISYDGNILAIGGNRENHTYTTEGEVTVYEYDSTNNTWTEMSGSPLTQPTSTAANDYFGNSVGINGDGTILAIAAAHSDRRGSSRGDIFVFKYINNTWTFFQYLDFGEYSWTASCSDGGLYISRDGSMIGSGHSRNSGPWSGDGSYHSATGAMYVHKLIDNSYKLIGYPIFGRHHQEYIASGYALSSDGSTFVQGSLLNWQFAMPFPVQVYSIQNNNTTFGQYKFNKLAYSGSSFSGKKLENSYPNLYLNTAAHDISYGFTEDHTNIVYDLSHNKNQLPIIDMSGGGGIHIAPREISIQDGSLNTINIHKPIIKNTYSKPTYAENTYSIVAPATDASFNTEFYSNFGARDASEHFNKRISQDGKTIVTLQNRGTQAYDLSNAEVVFSTDYGKNWKNILRDCSDSFLFTENDISYGLLFATGDVSGAIDIATSSNGQTMYVGRHRSIFSDANTLTYGELGYSPPQELSIPGVAATNTHTGNNYGGNVTNFRYFPQCFIGNNTGSSDITVSNLTGNEAAFNGTFKVSLSSGLSITNSGHKNLWGILGTDTWSGQYGVNGYTLQASNFNNNRPTVSYVGGSITLHYLLLEFPAYVKFDTWYYWVDDRFRTGYFIGTDANGDNQLLGSWSDSWNNGQAIYARSFNGANNTYVNKLYIMLDNQGTGWGYLQPMWFTGSYQLPETRGAPIPTNGLPEIYSTNYGNSWKLSPRKYHKGPTIISGDGSTILLLQESKLDNTKHAYSAISGDGNNTALVDTHWITTDYGSNWNTLNRSGYDISNNVIPPSYGSKTATFLKACMSYTGQYIYIYNVQCTTNNNYGELYYSHDYGNTWNKWTTVEAQNYIASGNTLAGSGQILCSGNGKYVFIAGQTAGSSRLSQAIYYRSTDYGVTFNKDITTFPWQEGSSGEDSTSRGPFVSYEGDLIVISNTHYKYIDDSDATISYGSSQYSGLQYSLDYGVNYNVLELNEEPLSTVTNNFSNLPNQTNEFFSSLFSTKGDIFSNCPGPNDYSFLTTVMGGNTTDASFVFLQSIEFPKDKVSASVEKEGPVITTYEEPIDTENDFGNITNTTTLTSGVSFYSSAISEDGQVLLSAGAIDVSNGSYYGAYNLTNAKFPPTENVYDTTGNGVLQPSNDWNFLVTGAVGDIIYDQISNVTATYESGFTSDATNGATSNIYTARLRIATSGLTFQSSFSFEMVVRINVSYSYHQLFFSHSGANLNGTGLYFGNSTSNKLRFFVANGSGNLFTSDSTGTYTGSALSMDGSTFYHIVCVLDKANDSAYIYQDGTKVWEQTSLSLSESDFPITPSTYVAIGREQQPTDINVKKFRVWGNTALSANEITTLYNNQNTVYTADSWKPEFPHFKTAQLSYDGNQALLVPYGITQTTAQNLYYWTASGDFHRFDGSYLSNFDAENWKFGKLSGNGNFFVGFTHSSTTLSDASYNSATWWQDKVSNTMIIYKNLYTISRGTVSDSDATTYGQGTTYDLNTAFSTDSGVTEYYITSVHVSETGQYVLFVGGSSDTTLTNRCAFSKDYGSTFTNITSLFSFTDITKPLVYCHVSDNGRYLFISQYNSSEYCFSTDYGSSFTMHNTFPSSTKTYGVVSKDGQNALFVDTNKHVYVSVNGNFRQEVIPSLSGTNTNLSLNHNYWKYKTTTSMEITYNPSMPNIKYLIGTVSDPYLINHYLFENNYNDSSGKDNHLTEAHTSHTFSQNTSYTSIPISYHVNSARASVDFTQNVPLSIAFWWNPQAGSSTYTPFSIGSADDTTGYAIQVDMHPTGGAIGFYHNFTGGGATVSYTVPADVKNYAFSHYVLTIDSSSLVTLYFNGSSVSTAQGSGNLQNVEKLHIGRDWDNNRFNIGRHGDFRVYKKALSASEASNIYNAVALSEVTQQNIISTSNVRYTESYFSEIDIKGSLTNLSGTAYTSSDYRVKENVRDLENSDTIASLAPISYTQNNLHHKKSIGFLAHEFAESFPDLVDGTKDGPEMQSINYNGIIAILIKEIQTLRTKINKLKSEI